MGKELGSRPREEGAAYKSKFLLAPGSRVQVGRRAGERAKGNEGKKMVGEGLWDHPEGTVET